MKPDWDKLMAEYADHASVLIADVDCTTDDGKVLCETYGVEGFPTIKHGDPNNMEDYEGGRDLDALQEFIKENLGPSCGPANMDLCDAGKTKLINGLLALPIDELAANVTSMADQMAAAEQDLKDFVAGLQAEFEAGEKKKTEETQKIKDSGLGVMKQVLASRNRK